MQRKNLLQATALILFLGIWFLVSVGKAGGRQEIYERTDVLMGTTFHGTVYGGEESFLPMLVEKLRTLEKETLSKKEEGSELGKLNALNGNAPYENMSPELSGYLEEILELSNKSGGALDPTVGKLAQLWDFDGFLERKPSDEEIRKALADTGYDKLQMQGNSVLLPKGMSLDLGAVGKGIGADRAAESIRGEPDIDGAVIALGGSVALIGEKPDKTLWKLAIADPRGEEGGILGVLELEGDTFISTSGDYEKYFMEEGIRYHHILDPHTGYPANSGLISVTVVCGSGLESDGLSTACFVLGLTEGMQLLQEYGAEGIFVDKEMKVYATKGLLSNFTIKDSKYTLMD